ncbi:opsin 8, group member c isoform X3 [Siphateles boraxobius]|uniref:opsin 8, group member c isoform X3 n=1 Tax=Siphateles boraxobius TaxID=180520 RepID=UPI00406346E7
MLTDKGARDQRRVHIVVAYSLPLSLLFSCRIHYILFIWKITRNVTATHLHNMFSNSTRNEELRGNSNSESFTSKLSPAADIVVGLVIMSIVILSVLGNGVVLVVCFRRKRKIVGSELLCVNLAVVDFLCCICFYPLSILSSFSHVWLGSHATCVYYGLGCFIFGLCGMFTIAAISVIRYIKTCYATWLEGANIHLVCVATWIIAAVWSSFPLFGWGEYVPEPYGISCTVAWRRYHTSMTDAVYVICSFACFVLVPVLLIVVSQCKILLKIYQFSRTLSTKGIHINLRRAEKHLSVVQLKAGIKRTWQQLKMKYKNIIQSANRKKEEARKDGDAEEMEMQRRWR